MKREETRSKLIEGTIRVISRDGLDKASTKQIGIETGINEVYIYIGALKIKRICLPRCSIPWMMSCMRRLCTI